MVIAGASGTRTVTAAEFFVDYFTTAIGEDEILTEIRFPQLHGVGQPLREVQPDRAGLVDVRGRGRASRIEGGSIAEARVGLTNMGTTPIRATAVEQALVGQPATAEARARGGRARRRGHGGPE